MKRKELESKRLILEPEKIEELHEKLLQLGFQYHGEYIEEDTYYQHPCRDFKQTDEALRIRTRKTENDFATAVITYKGSRIYHGEIKEREEYETKIEKPEVMKKILEKLGFKPIATIMKKRRIYRNNNVEVTIDYFLNNYYLEVEGNMENIVEIINEIDKTVKTRPVHETYLEIFLKNTKVNHTK